MQGSKIKDVQIRVRQEMLRWRWSAHCPNLSWSLGGVLFIFFPSSDLISSLISPLQYYTTFNKNPPNETFNCVCDPEVYYVEKKYAKKRKKKEKKQICLLMTRGTLNATGRINQQSCCVVKNIRVYEDATRQSGTLGNNTRGIFSHVLF